MGNSFQNGMQFDATGALVTTSSSTSGLSYDQKNSLNSVTAPSLLPNSFDIPAQYNPADAQCVFARTLAYDSGGGPTTSPQYLEVASTSSAQGAGTGASYDPTLGLVFDGTANDVLSFDVSSLGIGTNGAPFMVYFEIERNLVSVLPSTTGLTNTGDYATGIALSAATVALFALWPTAETASSNGMIVREHFGYTSGSGDKGLNGYGANTAGSLSYTFGEANVHDAIAQDGDTHIPIVFASDGTTVALYAGGCLLNYATAIGFNAWPLQTIVFGRRFSGDSINSFKDGHVRNLMVIAGRSPLLGKSYGVQQMMPSSVFSNVLMFGDSYSDPIVTPQFSSGAGIFGTCAPSLQTPAYLRKYGYGVANLTEAVTPGWNNAGVIGACVFGGRSLIGWNSSSAPVNAAQCDKQAFPTTAGETYLWDNFSTFLAQSPTCVILQSATNDAFPTAAHYSRWLRYYLERLFGLNGNAATTVKAVAIATTPYPPFFSDGTSVRRRKQMADVNAAVQAAITWFQTTYPTLASYVTIADVYSAIGGQNSYAQYFRRPTGTDVHMGHVGKLVQAQVWGQALLNLQSQINGTALLPSSYTPLSPTLRSYSVASSNQSRLLGALRGANFNVTTDQAINLQQFAVLPGGTRYLITAIIVTNASISLTTAAGGFYTATSKGGTVLVSSGQTYSTLTSASVPLSCTLAAGATGTVYSTAPTVVANDQTGFSAPIYLSLTTPQGAAATADVFVWGYDLT